ncbi:uncharacterized protein [Nicotiana sylvestris]|uniref:uncharacterized protein n=1 Tax=Nicotiana sylvestris TaxID=4096 RepID=UPI00388C3B8C
MESVAQADTFTVAPVVSQARGGAQTPPTHTPEQVAPQYQTPVAQPVGVVQPVVAAQAARPETESSDAVITGTVSVCSIDASVLFDLCSNYSYMSFYFASYLVVPRDSLTALVYVSTPVGDAIVVDRIYRSCVVTIGSLETSVVLLLLDMVDFDVIFGMDWMSPYHAILDCHAKTVTLALPGLPRLEWKGTPVHSTSRVIPYMKARRTVEKGCLAYLAYVRDSSTKVPSIDSVLVVREFREGGKVIVYASRKLKFHEKNYPIHDLELKELNLRQRRWLELLKDYDITILYHPSKANMVADALSRKDRQNDDPHLLILRDTVRHGGAKQVTVEDGGALRMHGRVCMPIVDGLCELILGEAYSSLYSIYLGDAKMYQDLRQHYWWRRMKKDIVTYVSQCLNCQQADQVSAFHSCGSYLFFRVVGRDLYTRDLSVSHYQSSIQMAPYGALYGRRCRSLVGWFDPGEAQFLGTELVQDALDKVKIIQDQLCPPQSRQNSYANGRVRYVAFMVGERVLLRVSPKNGVMRFEKKGKLSPRYIRPFEIHERVGEVAYRLAFPPGLSAVHPVFHVSMLQKYHGDPSYVLDFSTVQLDKDLTYEEEPVLF